MSSVLPTYSDIARCSRHVANVPTTDIRFELHRRSGGPRGLTRQHRAPLMGNDLLLASSAAAQIGEFWHSSLADPTARIDPYSVVIGSARRSEFQSKLACPLEGLCRITRRERHGSGYVRKASASRGSKHR